MEVSEDERIMMMTIVVMMMMTKDDGYAAADDDAVERGEAGWRTSQEPSVYSSRILQNIQNTKEIKRTIFNRTKQDKTCKFSRKSSFSSYVQHKKKTQLIQLILCQLDVRRLAEIDFFFFLLLLCCT